MDLSKFTQEFNVRSRIKDKNSDFDLCDTGTTLRSMLKPQTQEK